MSTEKEDKVVFIPREYHREFIIAAYRIKKIDRWEAWKQLYNLGYRGKDLSIVYK